jgi:DNA polymerase V
MFALLDCNNFFASCERLFRPALAKKPVVVLSNNDGCVIARSNEAKALGIPMGVPYFQIKLLCKRYEVHVFSSNFSFYGDMSRRVMAIVDDHWPEVEIYSIDEAFLDLKTLPLIEHDKFCINLQKKILRDTGIPVSIGIGPTKTLAKLANHVAKRELKTPVFHIDQQRFWLAKIPVGEVWGVGRQWNKKLLHEGIYTAQDLANAKWDWIRSRFNVFLQRTAMELRGIACLDLQRPSPRESIVSSRSFGSVQTEYDALAQAVSSHCARAYEKLREQNLVAGYLSVFIQTPRFRQDLAQYRNAVGFQLIQPTDDLRHLTQSANFCLHKIFKSGFQYQKAGIYLTDLSPKSNLQMDLFNQPSEEKTQHTERLMRVLDAVNAKYGSHTLHLAAEGCEKPWAMKSQRRSPAYTTNWNEIPLVRC